MHSAHSVYLRVLSYFHNKNMYFRTQHHLVVYVTER